MARTVVAAASTTDITWDGIPNWIIAVTSALTLAAAVFAGVYAAKAAHWTKKQAEASDEQVKFSELSLKVAQEEARLAQLVADRQRKEADAAYVRFAESRLDELAPAVLAVANTNPATMLTIRRQQPDGSWKFTDTVKETYEEVARDGIMFRVRLRITFRNVSDRVARIAIIDPARGEIDGHISGQEIIIPPHDSQDYWWTRQWSPAMLANEQEIDHVDSWLFNLRFWVRDLGMNVRDTYVFNGSLRFFARDGSRLVVKGIAERAWTENFAVPLQERIYERLIAEAAVHEPARAEEAPPT